ncbi:hypothetical protein RFI_20823 [Reticulomyxa filosa]|uniref:Uncharacterized protein n=1 Tax=Reticulomyxa filosa TaxID=46433 RepID=X6MS70_RETFI|nr:hypothetical protein RFI_20823 [Reticulomyxa filosa]|eukprot:ETO16516.1 hypothetical protein RFI_20823 [Reticulomyxa filosa]
MKFPSEQTKKAFVRWPTRNNMPTGKIKQYIVQHKTTKLGVFFGFVLWTPFWGKERLRMLHDQTRRNVEETLKKRIEQGLAAFQSELKPNTNINVFPLKDKPEEWYVDFILLLVSKEKKKKNDPKKVLLYVVVIGSELEWKGISTYGQKLEVLQIPPTIEIASPIAQSNILSNHPYVLDVNHKLIVKLPLLQCMQKKKKIKTTKTIA